MICRIAFIATALLALVVPSFAQVTLTGVVVDGDTGSPVPDAVIVLLDGDGSALTDADGAFRLNTTLSLPVGLVVSAFGYERSTLEIGVTEGIIISLVRQSDDVEVFASQRVEKETRAPSSTEILFSDRLESIAVSNPFQAVSRAFGTYGYQIGSSAHGIALRGESATFSSTTLGVMDFRPINTANSTLDPLHSTVSMIDIERAEVILGPGSALFGPDVTSGVLNLVTKDPFEYPGTSVELAVGELSTVRAYLRQAGHSQSEKFGYKVNGNYWQGNEWPRDSVAFDVESLDEVQQEIKDAADGGRVVLNTGGELIDSNSGFGVNTTLYFRPDDEWEIAAHGAAQRYEGLYFTAQGEGRRIGINQAFQLRATSPNLFAQFSWSGDNEGTLDDPTFLYRSGRVTRNAWRQYLGQLQYQNSLEEANTDIVAGMEYQLRTFDSRGNVNGTNEASDDWDVLSAFVQTDTGFGDWRLTLASRFDRYVAMGESRLSPRLALSYEPSASNQFRLTANRAFAGPTALAWSQDADFVVVTRFPVPVDIRYYGGANPQSFGEIKTRSLVTGTLTDGLSVPFRTAYLAAIGFLAGSGSLSPAVADLLRSQAASITGLYEGGATLSPLAGARTGGDVVLLKDLDRLEPQQFDQIELGYKGVVGGRLAINGSVYGIRRKNVPQVVQVSPWVRFPEIGQPLLEMMLANVDMSSLGLTQEQIVATLSGLAGAAAAGVASGTVETAENPGVDGRPRISFGAAMLPQIEYAGADLRINLFVTDELSIYGSASAITENAFQTGDDVEERIVKSSLNLPDRRFSLGASYNPSSGIHADASVRYESGFEGLEGAYTNFVEEKTVVNATLGYLTNSGIRVTVTAHNLLDAKYRAFASLPQVGRQVIGKIMIGF